MSFQHMSFQTMSFRHMSFRIHPSKGASEGGQFASYLLNTEKCFQKQQPNICSFYRKHNFICAISLLISIKTTEKKFVDDHRQKFVEIAKDCLWNELQNYCVESTGKKISLSADWL